MINKIKEFFNKKTEEAEDNSHSVLNIATAALLIEVMTIDGNMDQEEMDSVKINLSKIGTLLSKDSYIPTIFATSGTFNDTSLS